MLPDFFINECQSVQGMPHHDFIPLKNIPEAAVNCHEIEMCPLSKHKHDNHQQQQHSFEENNNSRVGKSDNNISKDDINNEKGNANELNKGNRNNWQHQKHETTSSNNSHNFACRNHRYHQHQHHQHCNGYDNYAHHKLLRNSEDPLISHGAHTVLAIDDDENPIEFTKGLKDNGQITLRRDSQKKLKQTNQKTPLNNNQFTETPRTTLRSGCSNLTKQQLKVKANMMSAKNREQQKQQQQLDTNSTTITSNTISGKQRYMKIKRRPLSASQQGSIKLRFHHQALPPEYLNHYETTQVHLEPKQQQRALTTSNDHHKQQPQHPPKISYSRNSHENVRSWLQKIAEIHRNATANQLATMKNGIKTTCSKDKATPHVLSLDSNNNTSSNKCTSLKSCMINDSRIDQTNRSTTKLLSSNYSDLPYMGEITLDNTKPRRGRKPKKADICHLIYKNYGTTIFPQKAAATINVAVTGDTSNLQFNHTKANSGLYVSREKTTALHTIAADKETEDQPLNLCLRDHNVDTLSLTSGDDDDITETNSSCPTPITTPSDILRDTMLAANMKHALTSTPTAVRRSGTTDEDELHGGSSLTSYYQKILENSSLIKQFHGGQLETIQKDNQLALKIPLPSGLLLGQTKTEKSCTITSQSHLSPTRLNECLIERTSTPSSIKSEISLAAATVTSGVNSIINSVQPHKRKRSAIYIPPLPADTSATNPANEVSICKFKFTGGAHPTLQEKKMLSVDAGGNYRYFSGTGDKASRGYEYFPRESLQKNAVLLPGMNVGGEKRNPSLLESHLQALNHNRRSSENNKALQLMQQYQPQTQTTLPATHSDNQQLRRTYPAGNFYDSSLIHKDIFSEEHDNNKLNISHQHVKRCTHREKLEKTFKQQGFLIQTQQLESAEGATYCKFRQLKKFSRYLFRNWKDYLPEELQQQQQEQQGQQLNAQEQQYDEKISSTSVPTSLRVDVQMQSNQNINDTEMTKNDLRTSLNLTKSELESLLTKF